MQSEVGSEGVACAVEVGVVARGHSLLGIDCAGERDGGDVAEGVVGACLELPAAHVESRTPAHRCQREFSVPYKKIMRTRILVIDDEEALCEILKYNLEKEGFEVDTAFSAEEALAMDLTPYDLFIVDFTYRPFLGIGKS